MKEYPNVLDLTEKSAPTPVSAEENTPQSTPPIQKPPHQSAGESFWDMLKFTLLALIIVLPIRLFVAQPFIVSGTSMVPTFHNGEYLIVDEITYRMKDPERGSVIIFKAPPDTSKFFIKRIIALPNETVEIRGSDVYIENEEKPEGFKLEEPYVDFESYNNLRVTLGPDEYFVMGDNRIASSDSRVWGPLPEDLIVGRALIRLFPISHASIHPGDYQQD